MKATSKVKVVQMCWLDGKYKEEQETKETEMAIAANLIKRAAARSARDGKPREVIVVIPGAKK